MNYGYTIPDAFLQGIVYTLEIGNPNLMTIKHAWIVRKNTEKYIALSLYPISPPTHIVDV